MNFPQVVPVFIYIDLITWQLKQFLESFQYLLIFRPHFDLQPNNFECLQSFAIVSSVFCCCSDFGAGAGGRAPRAQRRLVRTILHWLLRAPLPPHLYPGLSDCGAGWRKVCGKCQWGSECSALCQVTCIKHQHTALFRVKVVSYLHYLHV